jgi:hypothetical protein
VRLGSVTPFFCRHSRKAAKRAEPLALPGAPRVVEVDPVEDVPEAVPVDAALALEDVVLDDELPQAAKPRQASNRTTTAAAAGLRLRV